MLLIYLILGIVQGFTEPIPVSSSGHLIIFKHLFNISNLNDLNFEIFSNFGSFIAIVIIFRNDIVKIIKNAFKYLKTKELKYYNNYKYLTLIIMGTIPAGLLGFLLNDIIEKSLSNIKYIGIALLITAIFLYLVRNFKGTKKDNEITIKDALKIGFFEAIAIFPGISRSGATIVGAMFVGLKRETAFKFSFMLYIPITLATMILATKDIINTNFNLFSYYIIGSIIAGIVTFFSTKWFKSIMLNGKLIYFVYYCLILGILVLLFLK